MTTDFVPTGACSSSHCRWHKGSSSRHQHLQDWLS
nr:PilI type IV pilus biogenesis protein [Escherichia coli]